MSPDPVAQQSTLKQLTRALGKQLAAGVSHEKLIHELLARGWPEESARHFIVNLAQTVQQRDDVSEDRDNLIEEYRRRILRNFILGLMSFTMMLLTISFFASFSLISFVFLGTSVYAFVDMVIAYIAFTRIRK